MANSIGVSSGLLTRLTFAIRSSNSLYETILSFRSTSRAVRGLCEELEALNGVLNSLQETITNSNTDFGSLKLPLNRCGQACAEFESVIKYCTRKSKWDRTSFIDWVKLRYMKGDINGFKNMLGSYKSTISMALGDANM